MVSICVGGLQVYDPTSIVILWKDKYTRQIKEKEKKKQNKKNYMHKHSLYNKWQVYLHIEGEEERESYRERGEGSKVDI